MPIDEQKKWMNDLMSFVSHKYYTDDFELLPADKYQNTRAF